MPKPDLEWKQQAAFIEWFDLQYPQYFIYHVPNGEKRAIHTAVKLKKMGVKAGVFDIFVLELYLYLEFKRSKREKLSYKQLIFKQKAEKAGYTCLVAHGLDDAIVQVKDYIENGRHSDRLRPNPK